MHSDYEGVVRGNPSRCFLMTFLLAYSVAYSEDAAALVVQVRLHNDFCIILNPLIKYLLYVELPILG